MQQNIKYDFILIIAAVILIGCGANPTAYPSEVDWETAVEILNSGDVEQIYQLHNLEVGFTMKDGQEIKTIEPSIDAIFHEVDKCGTPCSNIMLATE